MKKCLAAVALSVGLVGSALAHDPVEDAIAARQAAFTLMAANFGPLGAMAKGEIPFDKAEFARRAVNVEVLSHMPWEFFIPESDLGETKAKPEIWSKAADFKAENEKLQTETAKLAAVAKGGDEAAMKAQVGETAKVCKSCHKSFRSE
jgi:cytochrome c556